MRHNLRSAFCTIVAHEDNKGVVILVRLLQVVNNLANIYVNRVHHAGVCFHGTARELSFFGGKVIPLPNSLRGCFHLVRDHRFVNDAHLDKLLEPLFSQSIWPVVIHPFISKRQVSAIAQFLHAMRIGEMTIAYLSRRDFGHCKGQWGAV